MYPNDTTCSQRKRLHSAFNQGCLSTYLDHMEAQHLVETSLYGSGDSQKGRSVEVLQFVSLLAADYIAIIYVQDMCAG